MDALERLAVLQVLADRVAAAYGAARAQAFDAMDGAGVDKARVRVAGQEVGTATMVRRAFVVTDPDAYGEWLDGSGLADGPEYVDTRQMPADLAAEVIEHVRARHPEWVYTGQGTPDLRKVARKGPNGTALAEGGEVIPGVRSDVPAYVTVKDALDARKGLDAERVVALITPAMLDEVARDARLIGDGGER